MVCSEVFKPGVGVWLSFGFFVLIKNWTHKEAEGLGAFASFRRAWGEVRNFDMDEQLGQELVHSKSSRIKSGAGLFCHPF